MLFLNRSLWNRYSAAGCARASQSGKASREPYQSGGPCAGATCGGSAGLPMWVRTRHSSGGPAAGTRARARPAWPTGTLLDVPAPDSADMHRRRRRLKDATGDRPRYAAGRQYAPVHNGVMSGVADRPGRPAAPARAGRLPAAYPCARPKLCRESRAQRAPGVHLPWERVGEREAAMVFAFFMVWGVRALWPPGRGNDFRWSESRHSLAGRSPAV